MKHIIIISLVTLACCLIYGIYDPKHNPSEYHPYIIYEIMLYTKEWYTVKGFQPDTISRRDWKINKVIIYNYYSNGIVIKNGNGSIKNKGWFMKKNEEKERVSK